MTPAQQAIADFDNQLHTSPQRLVEVLREVVKEAEAKDAMIAALHEGLAWLYAGSRSSVKSPVPIQTILAATEETAKQFTQAIADKAWEAGRDAAAECLSTICWQLQNEEHTGLCHHTDDSMDAYANAADAVRALTLPTNKHGSGEE